MKQQKNGMCNLHRTRMYAKRASFENCYQLADELKEELFDGIFISFKGAAKDKSYRVQQRLLRRIVEKRQAQMVDKLKVSDANLKRHLTKRSVSRCLNSIDRYRHCC